jgi:hypothetical protein
MNPVVLATATHTIAHGSQQWAGTQVSGFGFFWLGLVNVVLLFVFLAVGARRQERPFAGRRQAQSADLPVRDDPRRSDVCPAHPSLPTPIRASDAEREAVARCVAHAMAVGRLDVDEGVERIDAAYGARHRHELAPLVADLPAEQTLGAGTRHAGIRRDIRDFAAMALVAAVLLQALAGIWELWPLAAGALLPFAFSRPQGGRPPIGAAGPGG